MACDELLVTGNDAARGLGVAFAPDGRLAADVLTRLFPWHAQEVDDDPWQLLLWANGRMELPGRVRQSVWRWHCAPLSEWDGVAPSPRCSRQPLSRSRRRRRSRRHVPMDPAAVRQAGVSPTTINLFVYSVERAVRGSSGTAPSRRLSQNYQLIRL